VARFLFGTAKYFTGKKLHGQDIFRPFQNNFFPVEYCTMIEVKEKNKGGRPEAIKSDAVQRLRVALGTEHKPLSQDSLARLLGCTERTVRLAEREGRLFSKPEVMAKFSNLAKAHKVGIES
jgi:hypothetical protein